MVIIAYLKHSFVKHQTTSDISIFLKKRVTEKSMQKTDQKLTNLPCGCSFVDQLIKGKTTNKAKNIDLCEQQINNNTTKKHACMKQKLVCP